MMAVTEWREKELNGFWKTCMLSHQKTNQLIKYQRINTVALRELCNMQYALAQLKIAARLIEFVFQGIYYF